MSTHPKKTPTIHTHPSPARGTAPTRTPPPGPPPPPHHHRLRHHPHRRPSMKQLIQIHRRTTPAPPSNRQRHRTPPSPNPVANNHHTRRPLRRARGYRRRCRSKEVLLSDVGGAGGRVDDQAPRTPRAGTPRAAPRRRRPRGGLVVGEDGDARGGGLFAEGKDFRVGEAGEGAGFFFEVEGGGLGGVSGGLFVGGGEVGEGLRFGGRVGGSWRICGGG